jgi:DNA-binding MarR family transcriptional regulator
VNRYYSIDPTGEFAMDTPEQIFYLLFQIGRYRDAQFDRLLATVGMTNLRWQTFQVVRRIDDCSMSDLSRFSGIDRTTLTRSIDRLVKDGLVERCAHPSDRRLVLLKLTPVGETFHKEAVGIAMAFNRKVIETIPPENRRELARLLGTILGEVVVDPDDMNDILSFSKIRPGT